MTDLSDGFARCLQLLGSLPPERVVVPKAASDLVDGFVAKTRVRFESGLVGRVKDILDCLSIVCGKFFKIMIWRELLVFGLQGRVDKSLDGRGTSGSLNLAKIKITSVIGAGSGKLNFGGITAKRHFFAKFAPFTGDVGWR